MTRLVTLDEAKSHLNVTHEDQDALIEAYIEAASAAVLGHIGDSQYLFLDTSGDAIDLEDTSADQDGLRALAISKVATLLMVGEFFRNREPAATDVVPDRFGYLYMPRAVVAILAPLRTPTIA